MLGFSSTGFLRRTAKWLASNGGWGRRMGEGVRGARRRGEVGRVWSGLGARDGLGVPGMTMVLGPGRGRRDGGGGGRRAGWQRRPCEGAGVDRWIGTGSRDPSGDLGMTVECGVGYGVVRVWTVWVTRVGSSSTLTVAWPRVVGKTQRMRPFWTFLSRSMASRMWAGSMPV